MLVALSACATASPLPESEVAGCEATAEAVSFEDACEDESSLLALCDERQCGLFRCREVLEHLTPGRVAPTKGGGLSPLGARGAAQQRFWGSAQQFPWNSRPVFIIPWGPKPPLLPSQQQQLAEEEERRRRPHEKHHIFSRAFKKWFEWKKINIDKYTMPLEVEKHRSIHWGSNGGPWNAAWAQFIKEHGDATQEEIFQYAGQLIYEFELYGPIVPYWRQPIRPMPSGY